jgi:N-acetylglutamate synthase-like GNAT family acetyltransferase
VLNFSIKAKATRAPVASLETVVRRALPNDAQSITALYAQLIGNKAITVLPERIAEVSRRVATTALFVSERQGRVCGTALVSLCADVMFKAQPFAVVENVVVESSARGRGVGALLFKHIEAFCLAHDCSKIMLLSSVDRGHAHRFFERMGFVGASKRGFVKYRRNFDAKA